MKNIKKFLPHIIITLTSILFIYSFSGFIYFFYISDPIYTTDNIQTLIGRIYMARSFFFFLAAAVLYQLYKKSKRKEVKEKK